MTVMTRNVYHGANFGPLFAAKTLPQLLAAVRDIFAGVQATNIPERAEALADEIKETRPDLIGLQEAVLWRSQFPADFSPMPNATTIEFDFVQLLLDALAARGLEYGIVAISTGTDAEAPGLLPDGTCCRDIRFTDREVILARTDLHTSDLKLSNPQVGNFATNCVIPSITGPTTILRGWAAVDGKIRGKEFRFVTTHLDGDCLAFTSAIQVAQANEILQGPANTALPVIFVGDFNSNADGSNNIPLFGTPTYGNLIAAGFEDAWSLGNPEDPGFTFGQAADLLNPISTLSVRIDLVLFRGDLDVEDVEIVGADEDERTPSGLWPSDHAGVVATLEF